MLDLSYYNIFRPSRLCLLQYCQHCAILQYCNIVKIVSFAILSTLCAQSLLTDFNPAFSRTTTKAPVFIFHIDIFNIDIFHIDIFHIDISYFINVYHIKINIFPIMIPTQASVECPLCSRGHSPVWGQLGPK